MPFVQKIQVQENQRLHLSSLPGDANFQVSNKVLSHVSSINLYSSFCRFKCKICETEAITYFFMYQHITKHEQVEDILSQIISLPPNPKLEAWIQLFIWKHASVIVNKLPPVVEVVPDAMAVQCNSCLKWWVIHSNLSSEGFFVKNTRIVHKIK